MSPVRFALHLFLTRRLRPAALSGAAALAVALLCLAAAPARAHDVLIETDPADGAVLATAPTQVKLTFAQQALRIGTRLRVTGPGGAVVSGRPVQVVGSYVTQPLDPGLTPGGYTVVWRVTSADGHPVSGTFTFTLAGSSGALPKAAPAAPAVPAAPAAADTGTRGRVAVIGAAGLAVILLGTLVMVFLVRRSGRPAPPRT
ncbi:MAG TPA: copper resistance CopC family protein [Kineosporiaceae bacterium]|nr:copper resistance CopC family protein [Kineosporiaceae bacterium]